MMPSTEIKLLREVYNAMARAAVDIFPGFGPTDLGMVSDIIANEYDGTIGEWALYSANGRSSPEHLHFKRLTDIKAKQPTVFAKVLVWYGDPPVQYHVEPVEIVQTG